jgi:hypothetical protein
MRGWVGKWVSEWSRFLYSSAYFDYTTAHYSCNLDLVLSLNFNQGVTNLPQFPHLKIIQHLLILISLRSRGNPSSFYPSGQRLSTTYLILDIASSQSHLLPKSDSTIISSTFNVTKFIQVSNWPTFDWHRSNDLNLTSTFTQHTWCMCLLSFQLIILRSASGKLNTD